MLTKFPLDIREYIVTEYLDDNDLMNIRLVNKKLCGMYSSYTLLRKHGGILLELIFAKKNRMDSELYLEYYSKRLQKIMYHMLQLKNDQLFYLKCQKLVDKIERYRARESIIINRILPSFGSILGVFLYMKSFELLISWSDKENSFVLLKLLVIFILNFFSGFLMLFAPVQLFSSVSTQSDKIPRLYSDSVVRVFTIHRKKQLKGDRQYPDLKCFANKFELSELNKSNMFYHKARKLRAKLHAAEAISDDVKRRDVTRKINSEVISLLGSNEAVSEWRTKWLL